MDQKKKKNTTSFALRTGEPWDKGDSCSEWPSGRFCGGAVLKGFGTTCFLFPFRKAAEIKDLMGVLVVVAPEFLDPDLQYDQLVLNALRSSRRFDLILTETKPDFVLDAETQRELDRVVLHYNTSIAELALRTHNRGLALWNYTIKSHVLYHVSSQGGRLHPCLVWNYSQEGERGEGLPDR